MLKQIWQMDDELLGRLRRVESTVEAIRINPTAFGAQETQIALFEQYRLIGEILRKFEIPSHLDWHISANTGEVWFNE